MLPNADQYAILEEPTYFTKLPFHKSKLVLHRASLKCYFDKLDAAGKNVKYVEYHEVDIKQLVKNVSASCFDPIDHELRELLESNGVQLLNSPGMMETLDDLQHYKKTIKDNHYVHESYYKWQRRRLGLLMDDDKPLHGKWSFDKENRKPFGSTYKERPIVQKNENAYVLQAKRYVNRHFPKNFGVHDNFCYPVTHEEAKDQLASFIRSTLADFGPYQDAMSQHIVFGSHSVLSSSLNIGLLTPKEVVDAVVNRFNRLGKPKTLMPSVEGFVRQIVGWRSYVRMLYEFHGLDMMRMNALRHRRPLGPSWYTGTTGIIPIDTMIKRAHDYAYLHHIERLMGIGNFALLCRIHPRQIYDWFMICFIDSYEWVMVANVFGMSQYALKGMTMMTRPYISSSNYILKMSDYNKDPSWTNTWDALYYAFIDAHQKKLKDIYAMAPHVNRWNKMSASKKREILAIARLVLT